MVYQWKCVAFNSGSEKEFSRFSTYSAYVPDVPSASTRAVSQSPLICTDIHGPWPKYPPETLLAQCASTPNCDSNRVPLPTMRCFLSVAAPERAADGIVGAAGWRWRRNL